MGWWGRIWGPNQKTSRENANLFYVLIHSWARPLIANPQSLDENDALVLCNKKDLATEQSKQIIKQTQERLKHGYPKTHREQTKRLLYNLLRCHNRQIILHFFLTGFQTVVRLVAAIALRQFFQWLQTDRSDKTRGWLLALSIIVQGILLAVNHHHHFYIGARIGMRLRQMCVSLVHAKVMCLNSQTIGDVTMGQVINIITNDARRFNDAAVFWVWLFMGPVETICIVLMMQAVVGWVPSLAGMGLIIVTVGMQSYFNRLLRTYRAHAAVSTDERVRVTNEAVTGVLAMKMLTWEEEFSQYIGKIRSQEAAMLFKKAFVRAGNVSVIFIITPITLLIVILVAEALGRTVVLEDVYYILYLLTLPKVTLGVYFLTAVQQVSELTVSLSRMAAFLGLPEPPDTTTTQPPAQQQQHHDDKHTSDKHTNDKPLSNKQRTQQAQDHSTQAHNVVVNELYEEQSHDSRQQDSGKLEHGQTVEQLGQGKGQSEVCEGGLYEAGSVHVVGGSFDWNSRQWMELSASNVEKKSYTKTTANTQDRDAPATSANTSSTQSQPKPPQSVTVDSAQPSDEPSGEHRSQSPTTNTTPTTSAILNDVHLHVKPGELLGVCGKVGVGKSSLLSALIKDLLPTPPDTWASAHGEPLPNLPVVNGDVAYAAQLPWILQDTVKANIVFGGKLDEARYQRVLLDCALLPDLKSLPAGDASALGEGGVNLSGGQKARVSLARAAYSAASIKLLDDPLSAVDSKVAKWLWTHCIGRGGIMDGCTRILVTHQTQFLPLCDKVLVLRGPSEYIIGSWHELAERDIEEVTLLSTELDVDAAYDSPRDLPPSDTLATRMRASAARGVPVLQHNASVLTIGAVDRTVREAGAHAHVDGLGGVESGNSPRLGRTISKAEREPGLADNTIDNTMDSTMDSTSATGEGGDVHQPPVADSECAGAARDGQASGGIVDREEGESSESSSGNAATGFTNSSGSGAEAVDTLKRPGGDKPTGSMGADKAPNSKGADKGNSTQMQKEAREQGRIQYKVYLTFIKNCGYLVFALVLLLMLAGAGLQLYIEYHIGFYAPRDTDTPGDSTNKRKWFGIYGALVATLVVVIAVRSLICIGQIVWCVNRLHNAMLHSVLRAPLSFYHTSSSGRIMNRFSEDVGQLDDMLPLVLHDSLAITAQVLCTIVIVAIVSPYILLLLIPLVVLFWMYHVTYVRASREIRRLEAVTRSPVYSAFSAVLRGLATVRAYGMQRKFTQQFLELLNVNGSWWIAFFAAGRWYGSGIDMIAALFVAALMVLLMITVDKITNVAVVAVAVTQAMQLSNVVQWCMRQWGEVENSMTSVERLNQYIKLESEPKRMLDGAPAPPAKWPAAGSITYANVFAMYRPGLPYVLRGVCVEIPGGTSCGLVGRTGSGKSTLLLTLLRFLNITSGRVYIDDVDITSIGIDALRRAVSVIPQDPVLFSGTIRHNLDPWSAHEDAALWTVLEQVELKDAVVGMGGLSATLTERGHNLSVGQRQLFCLGRSLLSSAQILALDEATANVDMHTDGQIQSALRSVSSSRTLLVIAHRISTVLDCDQIVVMDSGEVAEAGEPDVLLQNAAGVFSSLLVAAKEAEGHGAGDQ